MRLLALLLLCLFPLLPGCAQMGIQAPFANDPLTGGVNATQSLLLHVPLPPGLQRYPSHSNIPGGSGREGLETLRGYVDQSSCAMSLYNSLKSAGWQMRMYQRHGYRAIYIYQKNDVLAALVFHRQGMLTVLEIWAGTRLADNAGLSPGQQYEDDEPLKSIAPEEYGPASKAEPGAVETWGVREKVL